MKSKVYLFLIVLAIGGILIATSSKPAIKTKVGIILPFTGPAASITEDLQRSVTMYEKQAKNIEFVIQDDQCSGKGALSAYNMLKNQGIKIYVVACSGSILALAPEVKEDGNVILTGFGGSIEIRKTGDEVIRFIPDGLSVAEEIAKIMKRDSKKYVLLHEKQDYPQSAGDYLVDVVGDQIVERITYAAEATSYRPELLKLKGVEFDEIIFIPVSEKPREVLLKEMLDLQINKPLLGDVNTCDQLHVIPEEVNGRCIKTVLNTDGYNSYITKFKENFDHEPNYPFYNAITFDVLTFIDQALNRINNTENVVVEIKKDALDGVDGEITSYEFEANGEVITKSEYLEEVVF